MSMEAILFSDRVPKVSSACREVLGGTSAKVNPMQYAGRKRDDCPDVCRRDRKCGALLMVQFTAIFH